MLTCGAGLLVAVRMGWIGPEAGGFACAVSKGCGVVCGGGGFETGNLVGVTGAGVTVITGGGVAGSGWL